MNENCVSHYKLLSILLFYFSGPPTDVSVMLLNLTTVRVTWKPPADSGSEVVMTKYIVTATERRSEVWREEVGVSVMSVVITGLDLESREYMFTVTAVDQFGRESSLVSVVLPPKEDQGSF